jgi:hypothetical protein
MDSFNLWLLEDNTDTCIRKRCHKLMLATDLDRRDRGQFQDKKAKQSHNIRMECRGRGCIAPTHSRPRHEMVLSGRRHAPAALYPLGKNPCIYWRVGWVGLKDDLDTEFRGKILCLCRGSNLDRPVVQSVARYYTDWASFKYFPNIRLHRLRTINLS